MKIKCQHCASELKGDLVIKILFISALIFGGFLGLSIAKLENTLGWGFSTSVILFIAGGTVAGLTTAVLGWILGNYELAASFNMKKLLKVVLAVPAVFFISIILMVTLIWAYFKFYNLAYADEEYGFIITNQRGWHGVPEAKGFHYQIGTADKNEKILSYFSVEPIEKEPGNYSRKTYEVFAKSCRNQYVDIGKANLEIGDVCFKMVSYF